MRIVTYYYPYQCQSKVNNNLNNNNSICNSNEIGLTSTQFQITPSLNQPKQQQQQKGTTTSKKTRRLANLSTFCSFACPWFCLSYAKAVGGFREGFSTQLLIEWLEVGEKFVSAFCINPLPSTWGRNYAYETARHLPWWRPRYDVYGLLKAKQRWLRWLVVKTKAGCDDWQVLSLKPDGVGCGPCGLWVAERWTIDYQSLLCL